MNFFLINNHYGKSIFQNMSILVSKVVLQTIKYCLVFGFEMVKIGWSRDKKLLFLEDSRIFPFKRPFFAYNARITRMRGWTGFLSVL